MYEFTIIYYAPNDWRKLLITTFIIPDLSETTRNVIRSSKI